MNKGNKASSTRSSFQWDCTSKSSSALSPNYKHRYKKRSMFFINCNEQLMSDCTTMRASSARDASTWLRMPQLNALQHECALH